MSDGRRVFFVDPVHGRALQLRLPHIPWDDPARLHPQGAPTARRQLGRERLLGAVGRDWEKGQVLLAEWGIWFQGEGGGGGVCWGRGSRAFGRGWGCGWEPGGGRVKSVGWSLVGQAEAGGVSGGRRAVEKLAWAVMEG